jgi:hypothetical protein
MRAIKTLLRASIDYAGLFPPASLELATSMENYGRYLTEKHAWALGRFILPAARLSELAATHHFATAGSPPWRIAALIGPDLATDLDSIAEFNHRFGAGATQARVETVEIKAASVAAIQRTMAQLPSDLQAYLEIPIEHPQALIEVIRETGGRAKVRTGGITQDAFPPSRQLLRFIECCLAAGVAFKATAGLHHALRAEYRLTYAPDSATGTMYGFLNLFLTVGFLLNGMRAHEAEQVLQESRPEAFRISEDQITWRDHRLDLPALSDTREVLTSFGSCSFNEPMEELDALQLLESEARPR